MQKLTNTEKKFEEVYKRYYTPLFFKALDWTLDEEIAKDLVEDLFVDLWQKMDQIRMEDIAGFLHTSIKNRAINHLRHQQVVRKYEDEYISVTTEIMDEDDVVHEEQLRVVEDVIEEQPPQRKFIFEQCCIEGKSYKDVSEIVGIEVSTIHKHVSRVYSELRKVFNIKKT